MRDPSKIRPALRPPSPVEIGKFVTIQVVSTYAHHTVIVAGDVDMLTAVDLHDHVFLTLATARPRDTVAINLSQVQFFGSSGIRVLLDAQQAAQLRDVELLLLVGPNRIVRRILSITGIEQLLHCIYDPETD